ncbi:MAG: hypothetical protein N3F06_01655, partial [Nitrososphaerales archaeon]|nr:hypothetical protein [Nitrososphaerales archaeon]
IRVHIKLRVKNLKMSNELDRLRITGVIIEASNEIVPRGSHHTLNITHGHRLSLKRDGFDAEDIRFIKALYNKDTHFIIVAIDRREAGIGIIQGTHMRIHTVIRSGHGGKHYDESVNIDEFYNKVEEVLKSIYTNGQKVFVVGPGITKRAFFNHIKDNELKKAVRVIEGIDLAGEDGIYISLHSQNLRKAIEDTKFAHVMNLLDEVIKRISRGDRRVSLTFNDSYNASKMGAVESLIISNNILKIGVREEDLINMWDVVESYGGKSYLVDDSTDIGVQVSKLGGVVALLRFPIN